ncbi:MAG: HyaD/HybD family hydrogenase maturation endopeptidase [Anaerolineales bacterium]|nr:HyaD/HybD family hydrogenase maturation endopeptidase [Chloroflexota bacterium]MBL6982454.1 HyaD/HybD family hydrogenase maturation endopeptidase [Anaerolineales bacterium]
MEEQRNIKTLILGVGNLLLSDEGVGVRVIERLQAEYDLPEQVQVLDGGTLGLDLLYYLEGIENLLIIDAIEMDAEPGELLRMEGEEVPSFLSMKMSPHQIGIPDMLFAAKLRDLYPPNVVLWGVQPADLDVSMDLSPLIQAKVDVLVGKTLAELDTWGHQAHPKS